MNKLNVQRITSVPAVLQLATIYFLEKVAATPTEDGIADLFITDNDGERYDVVNDVRINDLIDAKLSAIASTQVVPTIADRDNLTVSTGSKVYVVDATADGTVDAGGAEYIYDGTGWIKTSENESLDIDFSTLAIAWTQLTGGPTSTPAQIDDAVTKAHEHSNLPNLEKIGEDVDGNITYDGNPITVQWAAEEF